MNDAILKMVNEGLAKKYNEISTEDYEYYNKYGLDVFVTVNYKHSNQISSIDTFVYGNTDKKLSSQIEEAVN